MHNSLTSRLFLNDVGCLSIFDRIALTIDIRNVFYTLKYSVLTTWMCS